VNLNDLHRGFQPVASPVEALPGVPPRGQRRDVVQYPVVVEAERPPLAQPQLPVDVQLGPGEGGGVVDVSEALHLQSQPPLYGKAQR
jgi:hypothetical protein